jgi:hypothetical protein
MYVQSVQTPASLGGTARVNCALRRFVVRNAYRTTMPRDLLEALRPDFPTAEAKLRARGAHDSTRTRPSTAVGRTSRTSV